MLMSQWLRATDLFLCQMCIQIHINKFTCAVYTAENVTLLYLRQPQYLLRRGTNKVGWNCIQQLTSKINSSDLNASLKYKQLDFDKFKFQKASCEEVHNPGKNCPNVLLQSKIAEVCNESFLRAGVVFGNFTCSLSVQNQSAIIIFPIAGQLRSKLSPNLLRAWFVFHFQPICCMGEMKLVNINKAQKFSIVFHRSGKLGISFCICIVLLASNQEF